MPESYLPHIPQSQWDHLVAAQDDSGLYELLTQPLHEALYRAQDFKFLDKLPALQQMLLCYDYVQMQVFQGGFLQFIQNRYISLLLPVIEGLKDLGNRDMVSLLDDVLKVYVLNLEILEKETTVSEFAALYSEFTEFEILDERFRHLHPSTLREIIRYATFHPDEFAILT